MSLFGYKSLNLDEHHIRLLNVLATLSPDENLIQCTMEHVIFLAQQTRPSTPGQPKARKDNVLATKRRFGDEVVYAGPGFRDQEEFESPRESLLGGRQSDVHYIAISYNWGPLCPETDRVILINGDRFVIRENLWCFLDASRGRVEERLWIDQLCIDQNDVMERNHQVAQMSMIYAAADSVIVWLGNEAESSSEVIKYMRDTKRKGLRDTVAIDRHFRKQSVFEKPLIEAEALECLQSASEALAKRLYWSRLWIVQEILWAQEIQIFCGPLSIAWVDFIDLAQYCKLMHVQRLANARTIFQTRFVQPSAVIEYCRLDCSEPADKIFALQSLFPQKYQVNIDYSKPIREIFLELLGMLSGGPEWFGIDGRNYWPPDNSLLFLAGTMKSELKLNDVSELDMANAMIADRMEIPKRASSCDCLAKEIRQRVVNDLTDWDYEVYSDNPRCFEFFRLDDKKIKLTLIQ